MHHAGGDGRRNLDAEIPVGHPVDRVRAGRGEAEGFGRTIAVERVGRAGQRAGAERALGVHPGLGVGQAAQVAAQHPGIGHELVAEADRLGALQMGVARHYIAGRALGLGAEGLDQIAELIRELVHGVPQPEPDIQRDLVVAAAAGVQPLAGVADAGGQRLLDKGMHVLGCRVDRERAGVQILKDTAQTLRNRGGVRGRDDALLAEHRRMGQAAADVLLDHPAVEPDRGVEVVDAAVHRLGSAALPELCSHCVPAFVLGLWFVSGGLGAVEDVAPYEWGDAAARWWRW